MNVSSPYRTEVKNKILKISMKQFLSKGVKAVKMDDIAMSLSISKRTLYEIFADKEDLLYACIKKHEDDHDEWMERFDDGTHTVIDIIVEYYQVKVEFSRTINPTFFMELHKFSKVVGYLQNRHEKREKEAAVFFKRGIEEGYFRKDINYKLASRIGDMSMHSFMEKQLYQEFGVEEIFRSFIFVFIRGFCTRKGIKLLDSRLKTLV